MKLSDAILLGGTRYVQGFGKFVYPDDSRCAWGGAAGVAGCKHADSMHINDFIASHWPWVIDARPKLPCGCRVYPNAYGIVLHLNDEHRWPAAQIAQWVATVEPPAEEEVVSGRDPAESAACELQLSK